jgi:hypothetical protein
MSRFLAPDELTGGAPPSPRAVAVASLAPGPRLFVWGLRYRVALLRKQSETDALLLDVMRSNGVADAVAPLDRLVVLIGGLALRGVDVRCPACTIASTDELALLDALADAACGDEAGAGRRFGGILTPNAARFAVAYITGIARVLAFGGLPAKRPTQRPGPGHQAHGVARAVRDGDRFVPLH